MCRLCVSPDHRFFASCSNDSTVRLWDVSRLEGKTVANRSQLVFNKQSKFLPMSPVYHCVVGRVVRHFAREWQSKFPPMSPVYHCVVGRVVRHFAREWQSKFPPMSPVYHCVVGRVVRHFAREWQSKFPPMSPVYHCVVGRVVFCSGVAE